MLFAGVRSNITLLYQPLANGPIIVFTEILDESGQFHCGNTLSIDMTDLLASFQPKKTAFSV